MFTASGGCFLLLFILHCKRNMLKNTCKAENLKLRWNYVLYATVEICNVEQRWINIAYFNVDKNNVRQRRNNVVIFNVDFHNVGQCRNNVVHMTISIFFTLFKSSHRRCSLRKGVYCFWWLLPASVYSPLQEEYVKEYLQSRKLEKYWITRTLIKPFHLVKYQLVFNFATGLVQTRYD